MSFGGGRDSYTLEYIIKVVNQGGTSGISQVNTGLNQVNTNVQHVAMSQEKLQMIQDKVTASNNKVIQSTQGVSKGMKGLAFGVIGMTTAGAEFVGMMSMWRQTSTAVKEAQDEVNRALKESGENSKDYKDAVNELNKANRWARMTFRNLMLSMFDMVPFLILTINGIVKLRGAYKTLREAQAEQAAIQEVLKRSNLALGQSTLLQNSSYLQLSKAQRIAKAEQALMITSNELLAASNAQVTATTLTANGAISTLPVALGKTEKSAGLLSRTGTKLTGTLTGVGTAVSGLLTKILKIAIPIGAIIIAVESWKNNWGGLGDIINETGVKIGNIHPILKTTMELFSKIGLSIDALIHGNIDELKSVWSGAKDELGDTGPTEAQTKAIDELNDSITEAAQGGMDLITELSEMKGKDLSEALFGMGIKGGAKKRFKKLLDPLNEMREQLDSFASSLELIHLDEKLGNLFDLPKSWIKKVAFTWEDRFRELGKEFNDKGLTNLSKEMEKAGQGKQSISQAVINAVKFDPSLMSKLEVLSPEAYKQFKIIMDTEKVKLQSIVSKSLSGWNSILDPNAGENEATTFDWDKGRAGGYKKKGDKGGMFDGIKKQIEQFATDVPGLMQKITDEFKKVNWTEIFVKFHTEVFDPMMNVAILVGQQIITNLWNSMVTIFEQRKKEGKIEFTINDFFDTKQDTTGQGDAKWWDENVKPHIEYFWSQITNTEHWNRWIGEKVNTITDNPLFKFISNPISYIIDYLKGGSNQGVSSQADEVAAGINESPGKSWAITIDDVWKALGLDQIKLPTLEELKEKVLSMPGVKETVEFFNGAKDAITKGFQGFMDWINSFGQTASATGTGESPIFSGGGFNMDSPETTWAVNIPKINVIPGDILVSPPTNTTPTKPMTITPSSLTLAPQSLVYDMSTATTTIPKESVRIHDAVIAVFEDLVKLVNNQFEHMANVFSVVANSLGSNAKSGADQIYKALRKAFDKVINDMSALASHWSSMCNSLIANAKSAAKGINKALDSIQDEEVVIHYRATGSTSLAQGGLMSFANGGIVSAAGGKLLTTYGPQLFQIGDNPGGRESVWAIPHNNPGPTVAKIDRMYKPRGGSDGGLTMFNGNFSFNISGNDIINDVKIRRKIRAVNSENMDRYG